MTCHILFVDGVTVTAFTVDTDPEHLPRRIMEESCMVLESVNPDLVAKDRCGLFRRDRVSTVEEVLKWLDTPYNTSEV